MIIVFLSSRTERIVIPKMPENTLNVTQKGKGGAVLLELTVWLASKCAAKMM